MARDGVEKGMLTDSVKNITESPYIDYWAFWPVMFPHWKTHIPTTNLQVIIYGQSTSVKST